MHTKLDIYR